MAGDIGSPVQQTEGGYTLVDSIQRDGFVQGGGYIGEDIIGLVRRISKG